MPATQALSLFGQLTAAFRQAGYQDGAPAQVKPASQQADRDACAEATCPACHTASLEFHPFHRGRSYRVIAACPACGFAEEM